jgi:hypothetical protein
MASKSYSSKKVYGLLSAFFFSNIIGLSSPAVAQKAVCVLTNSGQKVCGKLLESNGSNNSVSALPTAVTLHDPASDYDVNLKPIKCTRKSTTVNCKFSAVIVGGTGEQSLSFYANANGLATVATDSESREYIATLVAIASDKSSGGFSSRFTKNQPKLVTFSFEVPKEVTKFQSLSFSVMMSQPKAASFSNFNISK